MIHLKNILLEQSESDNKLKVLFVGDSQTSANFSYAKQLIKNNIVNGKIAAKSGANTKEVLRLFRSAIDDTYDVVCVMAGGNDGWRKTETVAIENLSNIYREARSKQIIVIALSNPTKQFVSDPTKFPSNDEIAEWVTVQTISDYTVDVNKLTKDKTYFLNDKIHLNSNGHDVIYTEVAQLLNKIQSGDTESDETNSLQQKIDQISDELPNTAKVAINKIKKLKSDPGTWTDKIMGLIGHLLSADKPDPLNKSKKTSTSINANEQEITSFFIKKGLTPEQAAGIAGNLKTESEFNTLALGDNGTSYGLAQWHLTRWDNLKKWCKNNGYDPESAIGQLEFLWHELNTSEKRALTKLKQETDAAGSAIAFAKYFERPATISNTRIKNAEDIYNKIV